MSAWCSYQRTKPYAEGETIDDEVVSHDFGPKYACVMRMSRLAPTNRVVVERALAYNCQGPDGEMTKRFIHENMRAIIEADAQAWCWEPPCAIIGETQIDGVYALKSGKPPTNEFMECFLMSMVATHQDPARLMSSTTREYLESKGIDLADERMREPDLSYTSRSGKMKADIPSDATDKERKRLTLIAGPRRMRQEKDMDVAAWTDAQQRIASQPKPKEDICDAYLQGYRFFMDRLERTQIDARKAERSAAAQAKREAKEARRVAREAKAKAKAAAKKKRSRPSADDEEEDTVELMRPAKKPRQDTVIDLVDLK